MNPTLMTGTVFVFLALFCYSAAAIRLAGSRLASDDAMRSLTLGVALDATATAFMILGSRNIPFTVHGLMGYSALSLMALDTALLWRHRRREGPAERLPAGLVRYSLAAYGWWVAVFIVGAVMAARLAH